MVSFAARSFACVSPFYYVVDRLSVTVDYSILDCDRHILKCSCEIVKLPVSEVKEMFRMNEDLYTNSTIFLEDMHECMKKRWMD